MRDVLVYVVLSLVVGCGGNQPPAMTPDAGCECDRWPFFWDRDGDGYGSLMEPPVFACTKDGVPIGMTVGDSDCADADPGAYPNSPGFHTKPVAGATTGPEYDWDCNGVEERAIQAGCSVGGCR